MYCVLVYCFVLGFVSVLRFPTVSRLYFLQYVCLFSGYFSPHSHSQYTNSCFDFPFIIISIIEFVLVKLV